MVITSVCFEPVDLDRVPLRERADTGGFPQTFGSDRAEAIFTDLTQDLAA